MAQYIDKSALVAEIEKMRDKAYPQSDWNHGYTTSCEKILSFLDTLEIKEVDLDKETEMQERKDIENAFKAGYELGMAERNKGKYSNEQTRA